MVITIKTFNFPALKKLLGVSYRVEFEGNTLKDLINQLVALHGDRLRNVLLDAENGLGLGIQVILNKKKFISGKALSHQCLHDGDTVFFMMLAAGG
jgi:hypothetical protein